MWCQRQVKPSRDTSRTNSNFERARSIMCFIQAGVTFFSFVRSAAKFITTQHPIADTEAAKIEPNWTNQRAVWGTVCCDRACCAFYVWSIASWGPNVWWVDRVFHPMPWSALLWFILDRRRCEVETGEAEDKDFIFLMTMRSRRRCAATVWLSNLYPAAGCLVGLE